MRLMMTMPNSASRKVVLDLHMPVLVGKVGIRMLRRILVVCRKDMLQPQTPTLLRFLLSPLLSEEVHLVLHDVLEDGDLVA